MSYELRAIVGIFLLWTIQSLNVFTFAGCFLRSGIHFIRSEDFESVLLAITIAFIYNELENKMALFKKHSKSPIISDLGSCLWAYLRCKQISAN